MDQSISIYRRNHVTMIEPIKRLAKYLYTLWFLKSVAQRVEHVASDQKVAGLNPGSPGAQDMEPQNCWQHPRLDND